MWISCRTFRRMTHRLSDFLSGGGREQGGDPPEGKRGTGRDAGISGCGGDLHPGVGDRGRGLGEQLEAVLPSVTIDDILIIPSWEQVKPEDSGKMIIHIDPGTAFGTGMHETTQLCIRALKTYVKPGDQILDVGCGSGILGMLALKFGAAYSVGTDLDPAPSRLPGKIWRSTGSPRTSIR